MDEKDLRDLKSQVNDTHKLVVKIYKYQRRQAFFRTLKIVIIFVIIVGAYFALSPIFSKLADTYSNISSGMINFNSSANSFFGGSGE